MNSMIRSLLPLAAMGAGVALAMVLISTVAARLDSFDSAAAPARTSVEAARAR